MSNSITYFLYWPWEFVFCLIRLSVCLMFLFAGQVFFNYLVLPCIFPKFRLMILLYTFDLDDKVSSKLFCYLCQHQIGILKRLLILRLIHEYVWLILQTLDWFIHNFDLYCKYWDWFIIIFGQSYSNSFYLLIISLNRFYNSLYTIRQLNAKYLN